MKILIVQLLRLGDVILSSPVIAGLRDQYPSAQIDLLINKESAGALPILPAVDNCFFFDRSIIQASMGERDRFIFEAYDRVENLLEKLNQQNYDQIINLTQNKLSAYLVGGIDCHSRVGLWVDEKNQSLIETSWFQHLNADQSNLYEQFHFADIFKFAAGINRPRLGMTLRQSEFDKSYAQYDRAKLKCDQHIVVQALTSDEKKNWGLETFRDCIAQIHQVLPNSFFTILGAPNESLILEKAFAEISYCRVLICKLGVAHAVMNQADLVLTGDTSIKHIAAATKTPVIEISIGSSEFRRTGAYSNNALIIQTTELCAPCRHSEVCSRQTHACAQSLPPEIAANVAIDVLTGSHNLHQIAKRFELQANIYKVDIQTAGVWNAIQIGRESEMQVREVFNKFAAKLYIQSRYENVYDIFGSESQKLNTLVRRVFRQANLDKIFAAIEDELFKIATQIASDENQFYQARGGDFMTARLKQLKIEESRDKTGIRLKLSRCLQEGAVK